MKVIWALIIALPEIIALIKRIVKSIDEAKTDRKVRDDLKAMVKAYDAKDIESLRDIMRS